MRRRGFYFESDDRNSFGKLSLIEFVFRGLNSLNISLGVLVSVLKSTKANLCDEKDRKHMIQPHDESSMTAGLAALRASPEREHLVARQRTFIGSNL